MDVKSPGMLHKKAIQECRAESRVPEEQNSREFFSMASPSHIRTKNVDATKVISYHSYKEQVLRLAVA